MVGVERCFQSWLPCGALSHVGPCEVLSFSNLL